MTTATKKSKPYSILHDKIVLEPPNWPMVSLSEALTWIAFKNSKDCDALNHALVASPPEDVPEATIELAEAIAKLLNHARRGEIELTGEYVGDVSVTTQKISNAVIPANSLRDFRQFDMVHDGLRRGNGFTGRRTPEGFEWRVEAGSRDAYNRVEVDRATLMKHFAPLPLKRMTYDEIVQWCKDWIAAGLGNGMDKALPDFERHPQRMGTSRQVFRDAWNEAKGRKTTK